MFVRLHTNCQTPRSNFQWLIGGIELPLGPIWIFTPPKNVRRGVPKCGMASTQGEACPRQSINGESPLIQQSRICTLDAPLNQVNQARTLLSKCCGIRLRGSIGTELNRSKAGLLNSPLQKTSAASAEVLMV